MKRVDLDATVKGGLAITHELSDNVRSFLVENETPESKVTVKDYGAGVSLNKKSKVVTQPKVSQPIAAAAKRKSVKPALPPEATAPARDQVKKKPVVVVEQPVLMRR